MRKDIQDLFKNGAGLEPTTTPELSITPGKAEATPAFEMQLYGAPITAMNKLIRSTPEKDIYTGEITLQSGSVKFYLGTKEISEAKISPFASKLIRILSQELAKVNTYKEAVKKDTVQIPLAALMEKCGSSALDKFRTKTKKNLSLLDSLKVEWQDDQGKDYMRVSFIQAQGIRKGIVTVQFQPDMANYLNHAYIMQFPQWLYSLDERNPNLFPLACKLWEHYSNDSNLAAGRANILKVTTLLENCPAIPSYEEVMSKGRQIQHLIISPLLNTITELENSGQIRIEWCNAKRVPFSEEQLDACADDWKNNWHAFTECYLHFEFLGAKEQEQERLENRKNRRKRTAKAKAGRASASKGKK